MGLTNFILFFFFWRIVFSLALRLLGPGFDHIVKAELGTGDVREWVLSVSGFVVIFTGVRCMRPSKRLDLTGFGPCSVASLSGGLGCFGPYSVASLFRGDGLQR